jgi:hypothetical protein
MLYWLVEGQFFTLINLYTFKEKKFEGKQEVCNKCWVENLKERELLDDLGIDGEDNSKKLFHISRLCHPKWWVGEETFFACLKCTNQSITWRDWEKLCWRHSE